MLSVIMVSVIMLSVIMLSVIMLSVIMLSVIMLNAILLSVVAPMEQNALQILTVIEMHFYLFLRNIWKSQF
jgi:hypothetical protein